MNPDEKLGPGGGRAELLLYLLPVAAIALTLFVGVKYFQKGEKASRERVVKQTRRVQRKAAAGVRFSGKVRRRDRPQNLSVSEPPPPGAPRRSSSEAAGETASRSRPTASRADFPGQGGSVFESGSPGGFASSSARSGGTAKRERPVRRDGSGEGKKTSGKDRRGDKEGRSAFAGTAGGGGKYGAGGATDPSRHKAARLSAGGSGEAFGALAVARKLDLDEALEGGRVEEPGDPVTNAVLSQIAVEGSMVRDLRERAEKIRSEGRPATRDELREEAAAMMDSRGLGGDAVDPDKLVERALSPQAPVDVQVEGARAREFLGNKDNRPTEREKKEIIDRGENPPPKPKGPPPKGALDAYVRYRDTFDWIEQNLGVRPEDVLSILWTETRLGKVTGNHPVAKTFTAFAEDGKGWRKRAAPKELAALIRLNGPGLGGQNAGSVRGSWAGALGIWQCMPTSCEAYGLSRGGDHPDPFDFEDAAVSAANYLKLHGYSESFAKAAYGYNHSKPYVKKTGATSRTLKPGIDKLR